VQDVFALLDALPAGRVVLVGLSLGGNLAQEVVRREPDRVSAIVVADATCNTGARHPLATSITVAALSSHAMLPGNHFAQYAAQMIALDPQVQRYALDANGSRPNRETVRILTSLLTGALRPEQDYRLPVPALLVHGQLDHLGDIALATRAWAQREPLAEYAAIPAAGHASNLDNPAAFTATLLAFLDRVLPRRRGAASVTDTARRAAAATVGRPAPRLRHQLWLTSPRRGRVAPRGIVRARASCCPRRQHSAALPTAAVSTRWSGTPTTRPACANRLSSSRVIDLPFWSARRASP
jgi:dienelactone hydrolase